MNNLNVVSGNWRRNLRHGMGTYFYKLAGSKYMGWWEKGYMNGRGQLIHANHRLHCIWKNNFPSGKNLE